MNSSNLTNLITSNEKTRFCGQASQKLQRLFSSLLRNGQENFATLFCLFCVQSLPEEGRQAKL